VRALQLAILVCVRACVHCKTVAASVLLQKWSLQICARGCDVPARRPGNGR